MSVSFSLRLLIRDIQRKIINSKSPREIKSNNDEMRKISLKLQIIYSCFNSNNEILTNTYKGNLNCQTEHVDLQSRQPKLISMRIFLFLQIIITDYNSMERKSKIMRRSAGEPTEKRLMTIEIFTAIDDSIFKKWVALSCCL